MIKKYVYKSVILPISLFMGCTLGLNPQYEKIEEPAVYFRSGWYKWEDNINKTLFINYENEETILEIGTWEDELTYNILNIAKDAFAFNNVKDNLTYLTNVDPLVDLPYWTYSYYLKDYKMRERGIEGFYKSRCVTCYSTERFNDTFVFPQSINNDEKEYVSFKTYYYKALNGYFELIKTHKPLSLFLFCDDPSVSQYFTFSNSINGNVLENSSMGLSNLTNDFVIRLNPDVEPPSKGKTFKVEVHNRERKEDSYMFSLYLKL